MLIAHDPGHGCAPRHAGCIANGIVERDLVLQIAMDVAAATPWAPEQTLLRLGESGPSYAERAAEASRLNAGLVISHHINASESPQDGLITFYLRGDTVGRAVAEAIARAAPAELLRSANRCIEARPHHWTDDAHAVLDRYAHYGIPVVLIEWGFATDDGDAKVLQAIESRPALCAAAAAGMARAIELRHK